MTQRLVLDYSPRPTRRERLGGLLARHAELLKGLAMGLLIVAWGMLWCCVYP
jgi:hypothetical protein